MLRWRTFSQAIEAARNGHLYDNDAHVAAIRDGIALHLVRSLRYLEVNRAAVAQTIENVRRAAPVARESKLLEAEFQRRHGLVAAGPEALATLLEGPLAKWRSLDERVSSPARASRRCSAGSATPSVP